jgi:hypothetical protein
MPQSELHLDYPAAGVVAFKLLGGWCGVDYTTTI